MYECNGGNIFSELKDGLLNEASHQNVYFENKQGGILNHYC